MQTLKDENLAPPDVIIPTRMDYLRRFGVRRAPFQSLVADEIRPLRPSRHPFISIYGNLAQTRKKSRFKLQRPENPRVIMMPRSTTDDDNGPRSWVLLNNAPNNNSNSRANIVEDDHYSRFVDHSSSSSSCDKQSSTAAAFTTSPHSASTKRKKNHNTKNNKKKSIIHRFCYWYSNQTETNPLRTKSITGGVCAVIGDTLAQMIECMIDGTSLIDEGLHIRRMLAVSLAGLCYGPILHYVYAFMEHVLPIKYESTTPNNETITSTRTTMINDVIEEDIIEDAGIEMSNGLGQDGMIISSSSPYYNISESAEADNTEYSLDQATTTTIELVDESILPHFACSSTMFHSFSLIRPRRYVNATLHVAIDQGLMAFPFVAIMMVITGVVEGHTIIKIQQEFEQDYLANIHALWLAALLGIGPIQIIAFRFLRLKWRALAANILDVLEVMVMSYLAHRNREAPYQQSNDDDWIGYHRDNYNGGG